MRMRITFTILLLLFLIVPAWAQDDVDVDNDVIDSTSGAVEVDTDTTAFVESIPVDEETGMVDWNALLSLPQGGGATWGFATVLLPPDPSALANCPDILLDGAWYPPVPLSLGYSPDNNSLSTAGWWYLYDANGYLARGDIDITSYGQTWSASTWYLGGQTAYHLEQGWTEGYLAEGYYLPDGWVGPGIDYFIRSIWFKGIVGGDRMAALLTVCNAQRIGRDMINGGRDRLAIYQIPANELDRQNGRGSLLVWLTVGDNRLVRTRLHAAYATEMTEFFNVQSNIQNDVNVFYSDYLTPEIFWSIDQYLINDDISVFGLQYNDVVDGRPVFNYEGETVESSEDVTEESDNTEEVVTETENAAVE